MPVDEQLPISPSPRSLWKPPFHFDFQILLRSSYLQVQSVSKPAIFDIFLTTVNILISIFVSLEILPLLTRTFNMLNILITSDITGLILFSKLIKNNKLSTLHWQEQEQTWSWINTWLLQVSATSHTRLKGETGRPSTQSHLQVLRMVPELRN